MKPKPPPSTVPPSPPVPPVAAAADEQLQSRDLFGARRELLIEHAGSTYRLRITQANKLILTK